MTAPIRTIRRNAVIGLALFAWGLSWGFLIGRITSPIATPGRGSITCYEDGHVYVKNITLHHPNSNAWTAEQLVDQISNICKVGRV